ncbi:MAG: four helix bundle protein [Dehalococcoidia bacterium]|nr:MAG: four helix bundle protein [Dehalococcoidia bacterium]
MKDFRKLNVWQKAHELALEVYGATASFPRDEIYGLTSQIRRACVSIPANIAEGCGGQGDAEFGRFLQIAMGSASELEYHLILARELGFLKEEDSASLNKQVTEVKRMITVLIQRVKRLAVGSQPSTLRSQRSAVAESR